MTATKTRLIPVTEAELVALTYKAVGNWKPLDIAFGTGGCALRWPDGEPMPWYVEALGMMRGVLNENCDGAGI